MRREIEILGDEKTTRKGNELMMRLRDEKAQR